MTAQPTKSAAKRATARRPARRTKTQQRKPDHRDISSRAYFIHLEEGGGDELGNWLRAERELTPA